jgi:hypothetical protein
VYKAFVIVTRWLLIRCGLVVERGGWRVSRKCSYWAVRS